MPAKHRHDHTRNSVARGSRISTPHESSGVTQARVPLDPEIVAALRRAAGVDLNTPVAPAKRTAKLTAEGESG